MSADGWCRASGNGIRLSVQVSPNAKKTEVTGIADEALRIRLHAPPVDGKANEELIRFVADLLGVPRRAVQLASGHASKRKVLQIDAADADVASVAAKLLSPAG